MGGCLASTEWGEEGRRDAAPYLAPVLPPPSSSARLYKANRPLYSAGPGCPRPPYKARRLFCDSGAGAGGRGRRCHQAPAEHPPPTLPQLKPLGYPNLMQVPVPAPRSPQLLLWDPGKKEPQCPLLSNGTASPLCSPLSGKPTYPGVERGLALHLPYLAP